MTEQVMKSCTKLLEQVFQYEFGTDYFYILLAATGVILCGITWLLARTFGGKSGFILACVATILPLLIGIVGYSMTEVYLVPLLEFSWAPTYLPWAGFALMAILTLIVPTKKMLGVGGGVAIFIFVMASAAAGIAYYGADVLIDMADKGGEKARQQKSRAIDQIAE